MTQLTRRGFGKALTAAGVTTALTSMQKPGPNDRVLLGFVGLGNRGDQVLDGFLEQRDAEVIAICDLYQPYLDFACKRIGANPRQFKDYRRLLDIHEIDAVVICTPDHWHALQTIHACQAGKDVYVEKPLSLRVAEGRRMVEAARRYNRVTQVGLMRRSSPFCKEAVELIRGGGIGKVSSIRCFHIENEWPKGIGNPPDEGPPEDLDWDAWLGPAPQVPYNRNRAFYRFRWFYDYSGGQVTNFGAHFVDFVHWTLGLDAPLAVTGMGAKLAVEDNREIPDTLEVLWTYPGGTLVTFSQFNANGAPADRRGSNIEVRGTKGTLYLSWDGYEVVPEEITDQELPARSPLHRASDSNYGKTRKAEITPSKVSGKDSTALHARNFLDCVRSRGRCNCDIETGHRSTTATQIANIAHQVHAYLAWDSQNERFTNNDGANKLLDYEYRAPYRIEVLRAGC
jgi:predicted dehydrogenase